MSYCTVEQVASEFKNIKFTEDSAITIYEVQRFIAEADAVIDGKLSQVYVTPITGDVSLLIIQKISIWLVAQRIKDIQQLKTGDSRTNQLDSTVRLDKKAMDLLEQIIKDDIGLQDAQLKELTGAVSSHNAKKHLLPIFKREVVQW